MSEPTTPTGRRLAEECAEDNPEFRDWVLEGCLAIEAEARASERERLRAKWMELRPDDGWPPGWAKVTEAVMALLADPEPWDGHCQAGRIARRRAKRLDRESRE
jgi:hypothetical protein